MEASIAYKIYYDEPCGVASTTGISDRGSMFIISDTAAELPSVSEGCRAYAKNTSSFYVRTASAWQAVGGSSQAFPVGSVYIAVVSTDPATLLGYGIWAAFGTGRMLVGIDAGQTEFDTVEETGGAKTVTLDSTMIPAHTHAVTDPGHNHTQNAHNHGVTDPGHVHAISTGTTDGSVGRVDSASSAQAATFNTNSATTGLTVNNATATNIANTTGITIGNTGGGAAHSNLPPYVVVYMWKRLS